MEILVKRLLESKLVAFHNHPMGSAEFMGIRVEPLLLTATPEGRNYYDSLGLETQDWSENDS